jgi:hypothetical protein
MSTQHTPGPWYLRTNKHKNCDGSAWGWLDTQQAGNQRPPSGVDVTWSAGQTSEANARLIAAAPDLLEALKKMLDSHEDACTGYGEGAAEKARAAIAKATGAA